MQSLAPQVASQDPLQAAAYAQALDPTNGLGSYQPFLTKAGQAATGATALTGTGAGTGSGSIQSYMSPYQSDVIDTALTEFDRQAQAQKAVQANQALGIPGAFGGGREGVLQSEYQSASDRNRAALQSGLLHVPYHPHTLVAVTPSSSGESVLWTGTLTLLQRIQAAVTPIS